MRNVDNSMTEAVSSSFQRSSDILFSKSLIDLKPYQQRLCTLGGEVLLP